MNLKKIDKYIYDFDNKLSKKIIKLILTDNDIKRLQTTKVIPPKTWKLINDIIIRQRPDMKIRIYSCIGEVDKYDLSFLEYLKDVEHLSIDTHIDIINCEYLSCLSKLKSFGINIFELENSNIFKHVNANISKLHIMKTRNKVIDLSILTNFTNLKELYIENQTKNIESISSLKNLTHLTLRSISVDNLEFLLNLTSIQSLKILLGGIKNFTALEKLQSIRYLELWRIRNFSDLSFISMMKGLEIISLQALSKVTSFPSFAHLNKLKILYLETLSGITDFSNLNTLISLEYIYILDAAKHEPEDYYIVFNNKSLKGAVGAFGSFEKNNKFNNKVQSLNLESKLRFDKRNWFYN